MVRCGISRPMTMLFMLGALVRMERSSLTAVTARSKAASWGAELASNRPAAGEM